MQRPIAKIMVGVCLLLATALTSAAGNWQLIHSQGIMHFVHIDTTHPTDMDQYREAIAGVCGIKDICQVLFWTDIALTPKMLPMSDEQLDAKVAHWQRNSHTGLRRMLWPCAVIDDPAQCF